VIFSQHAQPNQSKVKSHQFIRQFSRTPYHNAIFGLTMDDNWANSEFKKKENIKEPKATGMKVVHLVFGFIHILSFFRSASDSLGDINKFFFHYASSHSLFKNSQRVSESFFIFIFPWKKDYGMEKIKLQN
jgi:hypothetical protein